MLVQSIGLVLPTSQMDNMETLAEKREPSSRESSHRLKSYSLRNRSHNSLPLSSYSSHYYTLPGQSHQQLRVH